MRPLFEDAGPYTPLLYRRHIWLSTGTNKYYFADETEQFVGPYDTEEEAVEAMKAHAETL